MSGKHKKKQERSNCQFVISPIDFGLWRNRKLALFLNGPLKIDLPGTKKDACRLGWGRKASGLRAVRLANLQKQKYCLLEDGFLRSVGLGANDPPLSIVFDHEGIYYDANCPSTLESLIQKPLTSEQLARSRTLIELWRAHRISKYNHLPEYIGQLPTRYVLVADQTWGDAALRYGQASATDFTTMLQAALVNHPESTILVKIHPDVFAGHKKGHFEPAQLKSHPRVQILAENVHPVRLIEHAEAVYVVTSQLGFEGLLWGKPVYTYGMPFYGGYGLSHDSKDAPDRRQPATLEQLTHAALIQYPRYVDPETGKICPPERLIEWMGLQRRMRSRFISPIFAPNFSSWKRPIVERFFQGMHVHFIDKTSDFPGTGTLAIWGRPANRPDHFESTIFLEDGFLRSVGLGADLVRPISWVMDRTGIYYDSSRPSDLEHILQNTEFNDNVRRRAEALRGRIVATNLTKYNVGNGQWQRPSHFERVILVPGQVESDASIRYGSPIVRHNMDLLQAVRQANPHAYVIYKPHPDVVAGLRDRGRGELDALQWCDEIVIDYPIGTLFAQVDEIHVLTSLAGFEALLRGKPVVTYGQPFYAGWGLTHDKHPPSRRTRKLTLNELIAGTLILYPVYVSRYSGRYTTPENALQELLLWKEQGISTMPAWRKVLRPVLGTIAKIRGKR